MTEYEFYLSLRARYNAKEYALIPQVRNGTGFAKRARTADAIAVSLWPSRGIDAIGFEFKDSRTDWLKELKDPEKADEIGRHCAYWWVVVSDKEIAKANEIPAAWGLMVASDKGVKTIKEAPRRDAKDPDWLFVAAVLRAAVEVVTDEKAIAKRVQEAEWKVEDKSRKHYEEKMSSERKRHADELTSIRSRIADFEAASGIRIDTWRHSYGDNVKIGEAVRLIVSGGFAREISAFEQALRHMDSLRDVADEMRAIAEGIKKE